MTLNQHIENCIKLRDSGPPNRGFGNLEMFIQDDQGGSFLLGRPRVVTKEDLYAEYGPLEEENREDLDDEIIVLSCCTH